MELLLEIYLQAFYSKNKLAKIVGPKSISLQMNVIDIKDIKTLKDSLTCKSKNDRK